MLPSRVPSATYRLQFSENFRFSHAIQILDYLSELGITHVYASPILGSRHGSEHGYDATDPTRIDPDLGSEEDFETFQRELQRRGMGMLLDLVPNHMAASSENPWWMDVLENGPGSAFASYFDINWHPGSRALDGRILLPVLGRPFGEVLDSGELQLIFREGKFSIQYFDSRFPLAPKSYARILNQRMERLREVLAEETTAYQEYSGVAAALSALFRGESAPLDSYADKRTKFEGMRSRLKQVVASSPEAAEFVEDNIQVFNGTPGDPATFGLLEGLLSEQHYKLAYWQNVNESINYRRFFTITDLVGMRVEDPAVFEATHSLILRIVSRYAPVGLRIDHIDGLRDPEGYLQRLQESLRNGQPAEHGPETYLLVEKIVAPQEQIPVDWPVDGTTGYDYLNYANGIFVYRDNAAALTEIYSRFIGKELKFSEVVTEKKKLVMNSLLGVEVRALGRQLAELAERDRYARELPRADLTGALIETTASLPVYRTYVRNLVPQEEAKQIIEGALETARTAKPHLDARCFDFLRDVLLVLNPPHVQPDQREARLAFVVRWQQFTGPIVAKGVEDTALYVYHPLLSLNEVGGDAEPAAAPSKQDFCQFLRDRRKRWPNSLNATTTHDTKRSEDVRARINVLSEIPEQWEERLKKWAALNAVHKADVNGRTVPDGNEEYYFYQTLLGAYPADNVCLPSLRQRLQEHVVKATREAMVHTRWTRPNLAHEQALTRFVEAVLCTDKNNEFWADFLPFHAGVAFWGMINSLSQTLLKMTCPGVPDFYQGSELWDLRLVDPDNRQPVDFESRDDLLNVLGQRKSNESIWNVQDLMNNWPNGQIKLFLIRQALSFRRQHASLFTDGEYQPLSVNGPRSECVICFMRRDERDSALIVVPRWLARFNASAGSLPPSEFWDDAEIYLPGPEGHRLTNVLTGENVEASESGHGHSLRIGDLLRNFPVALLSSERTAVEGV